MAYEPTIWKDRIVEKPKTYTIQNNPDGSITLIPAPGVVTEEGTPVNANNLNKLEQGLKTHEADNVHIPKGLISMWSGLLSEIPAGWVLCDGQNGTPNLTDRFIMGASTDETINKTGGANTVALTVAQIPAHTHTGTAASAGAHTHTYRGMLGSGNDAGSGYGSNAMGAVNTSSAGTHTHSVSVSGGGSGKSTGEAHENRPAYYTLAFIMKV